MSTPNNPSNGNGPSKAKSAVDFADNNTVVKPMAMADTTSSSSAAAAAADSAPVRNRFVSRHRQTLDRIKDDMHESRRHPVPAAGWLGGGGGEHAGSERNFHHNNHENDSTNRSWNDVFRSSSHVDNNVYIKYLRQTQESLAQKKPTEWLAIFVPMWSWLETYAFRTTFPKDLIAGLTVGLMICPQSMSYAKLAGLPVEIGLYSALVPVYAYAMFGSSRQLAVGPVALISLLLSTGLSPIMSDLGYTNPKDAAYKKLYLELAVQTSFLVGVLYIVMGVFRLGFVTILLSHAVISGFTTGAAVIIGMSQLKYILGYDVPRSEILHELLKNTFKNIGDTSWKTLLLGMCSLALLVGMKNVGKTYPRLKFLRALGPLTVTVISIVLVVAFDLDKKGIPIVKSIPKGLPHNAVSLIFPIHNFDKLMGPVISIGIVGFMESIAIAKKLASKHKYEIDSSTELIGLGMANMLGGMVRAYPVTGSFSRSAVNNDSGAQTGMAGIVTATLVMFVLLLLTPVFQKIPMSVLGAIVISGVLGLVDYEEAMYLWSVHKFDFLVWLIACCGTMFAGVEIGLGISVGVSLLIVIYESAYPHTLQLGRLPGTTVYRNIKQYPEAERYDGIVMVRIDAPLFFANVQNARDKIRKYRLQAQEDLNAAGSNATVRFIIIELSPVSHIDTSALHILEDMYETYLERGQQLCFSNPSMSVMERLLASGLAEKIGRQHFFTCMNDAVNWCLHEMDQEAVAIQSSQHDEHNGGTLANAGASSSLPLPALQDLEKGSDN